jgi:hypothetical protein
MPTLFPLNSGRNVCHLHRSSSITCANWYLQSDWSCKSDCVRVKSVLHRQSVCNYPHHTLHVRNTPTCGERDEQKCEIRKICSHSIMVFCERDQNATSLKTSTGGIFPMPNNKITLCYIYRASRYNHVKKNQLDAKLILSIFCQPLHASGISRPIIRGTTICIQQLVLIILFRWPIAVYLLMMGLDTPETFRGWRNILRKSCASSWFFFTQQNYVNGYNFHNCACFVQFHIIHDHALRWLDMKVKTNKMHMNREYVIL